MNHRQICRFYNSPQGCSLGENCNYFHVNYKNDNNNSNMIKITDENVHLRNICRFYNSDNGCKSGEQCHRAHIYGSLKLSKRCLTSRYSSDYIILKNGIRMNYDIKEIHIYDFDKTLFNTFNREEGMNLFLKKYQQSWPFGNAFYGIQQSISYFLDDITRGPAYDDCRVSLKNKNCFTLLLTGREFHIRRAVIDVIEKNRLNIPYLIFKPNGWEIGSKWFKIGIICCLLRSRFRNCQKIEIWEDRLDHLKEIEDHAKKYFQEVIVHPIDNNGENKLIDNSSSSEKEHK